VVSIEGVPPERVGEIEVALRHFAMRSHERWDVETLALELVVGDRQAWVARDGDEVLAVMLTRVKPEGVYIDAAAGKDRHKWAAAFDAEMERWAMHHGAKRIFAMARPGWAREAKALGWREVHREFVKEVPHGR